MKILTSLYERYPIPSQNRGMKWSLSILAIITLVYIALGFARADKTQVDVGFRQAVFLASVVNVVLSRRREPARVAGRCLLLLLAMALFWPTVWRFERGWENFTYRTHRFTGESFVQVGNEEFPVERSVRPVIKQWYP
jgi:hypothetical protein